MDVVLQSETVWMIIYNLVEGSTLGNNFITQWAEKHQRADASAIRGWVQVMCYQKPSLLDAIEPESNPLKSSL